MKKLLSFIILHIFISRCSSQEIYFNVDFFNYIDPKNVMVSVYDTLQQKIIIPKYEFEFSRLNVGYACLFAISKKYPEEWIKKEKKGECASFEDKSVSIWCQAEHLFIEDTVLLKDAFDIYVFLIDKKDLEGPFREQTDEGYYDNYFPKKNSNVFIYKYNNNKWIKEGTLKNPNGDIPKFIGSKYMKKLAQKRIEEYLQKSNYYIIQALK